MKLLLVALVALIVSPGVLGRRYITSGGRQDDKLNVHIICHSHDDAGWLKTVDQYFYGANNSIQVAGVQYILDTVTQALNAHPDRKFVFADMSFFMRWWAEQESEERELVSRLVEGGQLGFVNGGYVQHDEAAAHYVAMIDQTTRGHTFLKKTFGLVPRVGWQIDPFGHTSTQAGLLSAQMGFDALFFGRADYQDMEYRKAIKALEMIWRGSSTLEDADVFTGNFFSGNYGPPDTFNWDWGSWMGNPIMDDPRLEEYNVEERVNTFVRACMDVFNATRGNDIMMHMGSDFHYANAHATYKNIDKLIHYLNKDGRVNAFYSTPEAYVRAKHGYGESWPLKIDDFFPYADSPHAYWTGYFSSRPASKGFIRTATSFLQAARQLEAFAGINKTGPSTDALEEAVSLLQHHDAITGTEKQHVANDYHRRLHKGMEEAKRAAFNVLERLIRGEFNPPALDESEARIETATEAERPGSSALWGVGVGSGVDQAVLSSRRRLQAPAPNPIDAPVHLRACDWLNVSACPTSVTLSEAGRGIMAVAYNPLAWGRQAALRVPVAGDQGWEVQGPEGEVVPSQLVRVSPSTTCLQHALVAANATCPVSLAPNELVFLAELPPTGYSAYFLQPVKPSSPAPEPAHVTGGPWPPTMHGSPLPEGSQPSLPGAAQESECGSSNAIELSNGVITLKFSCKKGVLLSMKTEDAEIDLSTRFAWYNSSDGLDSEENRGQASGAYIFRPNGVYDIEPEDGQPVALEVVRGEVVSEARQAFNGWTTLITRLYAGQPYVEFEWTVGPIPHEDGLGREVVLRYASSLDSGDEFWTDANGREMMKRVRNKRPAWDVNVTEPAAGNYYPLTAAMYIQDKSRQLALLTERAQGGASLRSGELEVMLHRRTTVDDWRGVAEPLNETLCGCTGPSCNCTGLVARGVHWVMLSPVDTAARQRRQLQQLLNDPALIGFDTIPVSPGAEAPSSGSAGEGRVGIRRTFTLNERGLPKNVHLLTLKDTGDKSLLLRLAHLFQDGEDPQYGLSKPATVDLNLVLQLFEYQSVSELSLSGNQLKSEALRRLRFKAGGELGAGPHPQGSATEGLGVAEEDREWVEGLRKGAEPIDCRAGCRNGALLITLQPMEVKTFELMWG